jgi:hypothetical protein
VSLLSLNHSTVEDELSSADDESYVYTATNRLRHTYGPWGEESFLTEGWATAPGAGSFSPQANPLSATDSCLAYALLTGPQRALHLVSSCSAKRLFPQTLRPVLDPKEVNPDHHEQKT